MERIVVITIAELTTSHWLFHFTEQVEVGSGEVRRIRQMVEQAKLLHFLHGSGEVVRASVVPQDERLRTHDAGLLEDDLTQTVHVHLILSIGGVDDGV